MTKGELHDGIVRFLAAHKGDPQTLEQIAAAIPEATVKDVQSACILLRVQGAIGRNGAGSLTKPYRFYPK